MLLSIIWYLYLHTGKIIVFSMFWHHRLTIVVWRRTQVDIVRVYLSVMTFALYTTDVWLFTKCRLNLDLCIYNVTETYFPSQNTEYKRDVKWEYKTRCNSERQQFVVLPETPFYFLLNKYYSPLSTGQVRFSLWRPMQRSSYSHI